jgi:hypothetical protein
MRSRVKTSFPLWIIAYFLPLIAGCVTSNDFKPVEGSKVGVIIGYNIVGKDSINPAGRFAMSIGAGFAAAATGGATTALGVYAAMEGTNIATAQIGEETDDTCASHVNNSVYESIKRTLSEKGYSVTLVQSTAVEYDFMWDDFDSTEEYYAHVSNFYRLDMQDLSEVNADIILFVEYKIQAYVPNPERIIISELSLDEVWGNVFAYTKPPESSEIFFKPIVYAPAFSRMSLAEAVEKISSKMEEWKKQAS